MDNSRSSLSSVVSLPELKWALGMLLLLSLVELLLILFFNGGYFTYTLDDPYIHLALAENILQGHYGVNAAEYSAPSSSILWPLLLAPLTALPYTDLWLLLLNTVFAGATVMVAGRILQMIELEAGEPFSSRARLVLLGLFIVCSNVIGLVFTGMEHSLQVLVALVIFAGLLEHVQSDKVPGYLWAAIILAPLIRFECLSLSGTALLYLALNKALLKSMISGAIIAALLLAFSAFLLSLGLGYLPDSILAKSSVASSGLGKLAMNVERNLSLVTPKGITLLVLSCFFFHCAWFKSVARKKRLLAFCIGLAIVGHLLVGRIGWYFRYEIYLWTVSLALLLYIWRVPFLPRVSKFEQRFTQGLIGFCIIIATLEHLVAYVSTPVAASNIYHQQAQMQRFILDYYRQPVAVNDLGLATYQNDLYVLDLWGLGSSEARILRKGSDSVEWMNKLVEEKNIQLVMIYHDEIWFPDVPASWHKVAELSITGFAVTARFPVSFFAVNSNVADNLIPQLKDFAESLPEGSRLTINP